MTGISHSEELYKLALVRSAGHDAICLNPSTREAESGRFQ